MNMQITRQIGKGYKGPEEYKVCNGVWYHGDTPDHIIEILERLRYTKRRVILHYGDVETGLAWGDWDSKGKYHWDSGGDAGTLSRSTGRQPIPIIVQGRSMGGPGLLEHCIVKIELSANPHTVLYQHPTYHLPPKD